MTAASVALVLVFMWIPGLSRAAALDETSHAVVMAAATPDQSAVAEAAGVVRKNLQAAQDVARGDGTRDEKLASLHAVARGFLDTETMGRVAIGDVLAAQSPEQQGEYLKLFDRLIVRAYLQKLLLFREPRFDYGTPGTRGAVVVVPTKIVTPKDEYHVDYEMRRRRGGWGTSDVIVEGVSLVQNYHAQFSSLLRDRSFEELLDLMRRKTQRVGEESS